MVILYMRKLGQCVISRFKYLTVSYLISFWLIPDVPKCFPYPPFHTCLHKPVRTREGRLIKTLVLPTYTGTFHCFLGAEVHSGRLRLTLTFSTLISNLEWFIYGLYTHNTFKRSKRSYCQRLRIWKLKTVEIQSPQDKPFPPLKLVIEKR